jgi:two-component system, sensor histidine kinase and response regulator
MLTPLMLVTQPVEKRLSRPHVLIVEHDTHSARRLVTALELDYCLTLVGTGGMALEMLRYDNFDLVLLDAQLPEMAGLELLKRIRSNGLMADLPIILLSPRLHDPTVIEGLQQGANDYITGPFDMHVIRALIKSQLALKKRLDEQQETITYLKTRYDLKDRFFRIATHDLKNPLNNIMLAQHQLRAVVGDHPLAAEALDTIVDTIHSMSDLVEEFLDSAALENGSPDLQLGAVEVEAVVAEVVLRYSTAANRKNIALNMDEAQGVVLADYDRLVQILNNLLSNAIKFSLPDSTVTLSAASREKTVRICVTDQGPGIPLSERANLFKAFSKLSPRPTAGESSSGLGLWIVKEMATLQKGSVGVDCPADGGSIFWVELPVSKA